MIEREVFLHETCDSSHIVDSEPVLGAGTK